MKALIIQTVFVKNCSGFDIEVAHSFNIRINVSSWPWALFGSNDLINFNNIIVGNFKSRKSFLSFKTYIFTNWTWIIYCSKLFTFSLKSVISLWFSNNGGIAGFFVPFTLAFKIDQ